MYKKYKFAKMQLQQKEIQMESQNKNLKKTIHDKTVENQNLYDLYENSKSREK